jgi:hypothetical protein
MLKKTLSFIFKLFTFSLTVYGLYLTLKDTPLIGEVLSYFTTLVNVLTGLMYVFFILDLVLNQGQNRLLRYFKQSLIVYLMLTLLVYSFVLIPYILANDVHYEIWSIKDLIIHYAVPLMVILDYVFFEKKGELKSFYLGMNLFHLGIYVLYLSIYIGVGGRFHLNHVETIYPYFFLDVATIGITNFSLIAITIFLSVIFLGWLVYTIDFILGVPLSLPLDKRK